MALVNVAEQMKILSNSYRNKIKEEHYKTILDQIVNSIKEEAEHGHKNYFFDGNLRLTKAATSNDIQDFLLTELARDLIKMGFEVKTSYHMAINISW
jgi:hypothetical protein